MVLAIVVGVILGALSVLPFRVAIKRVRYIDVSSSLNLLGPFLLTIAASFVILVAGMVVCKLAAPDYALAFAIAAVVTFALGVIAFGFVLAKRR